MPGVNGDLVAITLYTSTTPVHFSTSNVPFSEMDINVLLLDQKLEGWIASGDEAYSEAGDGTFTTPVVFATVMNTVPSISVSKADIVGTGVATLYVSIANRTVTGFDLTVDGIGTAGAWTANIAWIADGR
jgi:hypothetical protein